MCFNKKITIVLLLLGTQVCFASKDKKETKQKLGITAGIGASGLAGIPSDNRGRGYNSSFLLGWNVGVYHTYMISKCFVLRPQLLFEEKSFKNANYSAFIMPSAIEYGDFTITSHIGYIELPVQLEYSFKKRFVVGAGLYFAYGVIESSKYEWESTINNQTTYMVNYTHNMGNFGRLDMGYEAVLGLELKKDLSCGIRITKEVSVVDNGGYYNFTAGVYATYAIW